MTTGIMQDQNLEKEIGKQMGCMAGFLHIFDRHQILTGKRLYATKRLPPSPVVESSPELEKDNSPPAMCKDSERQQQSRSTPSPDRLKTSQLPELRYPAPDVLSPADNQAKQLLPIPIFDYKEGSRSSWKFSKEAPRLSLDSRAIVDAKGSLKPREIRTSAAFLSANQCESTEDGADNMEKQRRSTSVIARLMGLESLPSSDPEPAKKAELRRSASESRASRDQYRFIDGISFQAQQSLQQQQLNRQCNIASSMFKDKELNNNTAARVYNRSGVGGAVDPRDFVLRSARAEPAKVPHRGIVQRKNFFDSADFFPEPKQAVSLYGEIEKRLRMRGIDEPSKDLETLKQILEALQLKGLLHSKKSASHVNGRNVAYNQSFWHEESPIVVMRPAVSPVYANRTGRFGNDSHRNGIRRNANLTGQASPAMSPRRERQHIDRKNQSPNRGRNSISPTTSESSVKSPRRRSFNVETQRRTNESTEQRRISPVQSPKVGMRRTGTDQVPNRSPRNKKPTGEIYRKEEKVVTPAEDEVSMISESSISTSSQTDTEKTKMEEYKEGRNLLERCDKLLHSIAEITSTELQPSPVSVLDWSFYKEESSPSPVMKRSIDFKEQPIESEDEIWSSAMSSAESKSDDCDFIYISDVLKACNYLPEDSDIFLLLEKQQYLKGKDTSKVSSLQRRLVFDTISEILNRKRQLPPWKAVSEMSLATGKAALQQIWCEYRRIRERETSDDLFEVICGVLKKDLAGDGINGWGDCPIEMSEAVLDLERLIFKDLIGETIGDLAVYAARFNKISVSRRKLVF
ncbi:protein LONGIFOLIA 1 [Carica papaya]|uniref:protein LONGIFOLIA 1 n=1 Tax=Carica papaya TaxID=3649 RepID=UPI000B8C7AA1|nr:protein LONGIFOLIA 1 [Carica papaya]